MGWSCNGAYQSINQSVEIAMMVTPDGNSRLELCRYINPKVIEDYRNAPVNALGYLRVMFAVADIDDTLERLYKHGAQLIEEVVRYQDSYRLCYIRGPEGILIAIAEPLKQKETECLFLNKFTQSNDCPHS